MPMVCRGPGSIWMTIFSISRAHSTVTSVTGPTSRNSVNMVIRSGRKISTASTLRKTATRNSQRRK